MDINNNQHEASTDIGYEAQRAVIRLALNDIAQEIGMLLRDALLDFPVYVTVPNSGISVATIATPLDPSDEDWSHASAIVCGIIAKRLGNIRLQGRPLHCAVANSQVAAAEVMTDPETKF
jgi:hypothetical protein